MAINTGDYMTSTLASCCAKFFNWDYDDCTGNHPDDCVADLFYPDWDGGSGSCIADGNEPAYMNTNSYIYFFNTKTDCCKTFYNWDYSNCVGIVAGADAATNSLYYPDWDDAAHICKSDGNQPQYMSLYPTLWMHTTLEKCCKLNYGWNYDNCMGGDTPVPDTPDVVATVQYYMVWGSVGKCVQDCDVGAGPNCGGKANFWDELFDSRSSCCTNMNWWNTNCDK
jgi:hypothetical protein